ncbi:class I SAM-dependent methyltransferase [Candidatus Gottesmanbacteria bacterium]|nr:class I SAM-dependent methyltransferase [Candidatus Gottesmanbacteria bacterium]
MSKSHSAFRDYLKRLRYFPRIIPPFELRRSGKDIETYIETGNLQANIVRKYGSANPGSHILDIGCGDGRFASALASFLKKGSYTTFEVNKSFVDYLKSHVKKKNFQFLHRDIYHAYYNPKGQIKAENFVFPFQNESFDIVFLNSIFTHFRPKEIENYLLEIHRVLKDEALVLSTYFIANNQSLKLDRQGLSSKELRMGKKYLLNYEYRNYWSRDKIIKERIIAVKESWLKNVYKKSGLTIEKIVWGYWCGREKTEETVHEQDLVIARKTKRFS